MPLVAPPRAEIGQMLEVVPDLEMPAATVLQAHTGQGQAAAVREQLGAR